MIGLDRFAGTIVGVDTSEAAAALTFDDGPHPVFTPRLLDVLAEAGARATFFLVGRNARAHGALVERMTREGHAIANHSWDHTSFRHLRPALRRHQMRWCEQALGEHSSRLFRPPFGEQSLGSRFDAWRAGLNVVAWDLLGQDWEDDSADVIAARVIEQMKPGSIVLLHDALEHVLEERHADRGRTIAAVTQICARNAGRLRLVTVPELLRMGKPRYRNWLQNNGIEWYRKLKPIGARVRLDQG